MINSVILMGRLTADPELRTTNSGVSFCRFSIAVQRSYAPQGQEPVTDFINCASWRQQAEFISKYFRKGQMIAIQGQLQQNNYTDKNGNKRTTYEVLVDRGSFCGSKSENTQPAAPADPTEPEFDEEPGPMPYPSEDDLPF